MVSSPDKMSSEDQQCCEKEFSQKVVQIKWVQMPSSAVKKYSYKCTLMKFDLFATDTAKLYANSWKLGIFSFTSFEVILSFS